MNDCLIRGDAYLARRENFKLVGRTDELKRLSAILMRSRANSVLLVGPGGVGCTSLCLGLQALKIDTNAPFDIVSKRFLWLDTDELFASGDSAEINTTFQKAMDVLYRTPDSVLLIEDTRDFIEAARNNGSMHFINALILAVSRQKTQIILEARDDDLDIVLKCHSQLRESLTLMDLEEPGPGALQEIVSDSARSLVSFHGVAIADDAREAAIMLTSKYRTRDLGLSRAQPERSVTLLDRALASYRLVAHEKSDRIRELEALCKTAKGGPDRVKLETELLVAQTEWDAQQTRLKGHYRSQREGEIEILKLEDALKAEQDKAAERRANAPAEAPTTRIASFTDVASRGGMDTPEIAAIKKQMATFQGIVDENKTQFDLLAAEINVGLVLTRNRVLGEFSRISGIPTSKLDENERAKLSKLGDGLRQRIFGQDEVVDHVADGIRVAKLGRRNKDKPQSFLFLGPSGVGKTEMAKAIAALLLDDERALTRFDMSEYMEKHAVAKMIGAPPGYEGFEAGGILTNAMRKNPNRVLLFDEIEKAHPDVFNIFLQILSDGRLTDNVGRTVSFADATIIMTTNIGQTHFLNAELSVEEAEAAAMAELGSTFKNEFLNRFNGRQNILCFRRLDLPSIEKIVKRAIGQINESYRDQGIITIISDTDLDNFCRVQYNPAIGARGLPGVIQVNLEPVIVNHLLSHPDSRGTLNVTFDEPSKKFKFAFAEEPVAQRSAA